MQDALSSERQTHETLQQQPDRIQTTPATPSTVTPVPMTPSTTVPHGIVPQLQNVVSTVNLGCKLDLKLIALHARNAEYNPKVLLILVD